MSKEDDQKLNSCVSEFINPGEEDQMIIYGYRKSVIRTIFFWILVLMTGGVIFLIIAWRPTLYTKYTKQKCSLNSAQKVILVSDTGEDFTEAVKREEVSEKSSSPPFFCHKKIKYVWSEEKQEFQKLKGLQLEFCGDVYAMSNGLDEAEAERRLEIYGYNSILVEIKPIWKLVVEEIRSPFYVYQIFIVIVWLAQLYYQFALCIFLFSVGSVSFQVYETRKQSLLLREKVYSESEVCVVRSGNIQSRGSQSLVPGDVLILPPGNDYMMECDAVLINGNCTVDESMLTGESAPVSKVALTETSESPYSMDRNKRCTLFCGTQVLNVQNTDDAHIKAIVIRTGYNTTKGELVRSILFPKMANFKLRKDYIKCMKLFFILGIPCMAYTAYVLDTINAYTWDTIIITLDVATFLCPPLLPSVMTSINAHAQRRLRQQGIFCLNSSYINFSGGLDVVCFDKTGTLTEDNIDFSGVVATDGDGRFREAERELQKVPSDHHLLLVMGCCHSLTHMKGKIDGDSLDVKMFEALNWEFKNDQMTDGSENAFEKMPIQIVGGKSGTGRGEAMTYGIIRQFPFESQFQRMMTICKKAYKDKYILLMKGAPEVVTSFCDPASIPEDWKSVLESYTRDGLRVLAAATKFIPSHHDLESLMRIPREKLESDLVFAGLIVFQNRLKPETTRVLATLRDVNIRTVMVTGDNMLTAVSVARDCNMIDESDAVIQVEAEEEQTLPPEINDNKRSSPDDEYEPKGVIHVKFSYAKLPGISEKVKVTKGMNGGEADETLIRMMDSHDVEDANYHLCIDGKAFTLIRNYDPSLFAKVAHKGTIFARMTPDQKLNLIEELQRQEHQVGMCGDGANDCGALRAANAGISLSVAESSVASPFTYSKKNIECFPLLIREGRATLAATFGAFKYQVCYCFVLLGAVMILMWDGQKPSDSGYVFIDIILNILPPLVFGTTKAADHLSKRRPQRSLFAFFPLFSIFTFVFLQVSIYLTAREYLIHRPWYEPFTFNASRIHSPEPSHTQLTVLSLNIMSYVISAIIFAPGYPYRKGFFSNWIYMSVVFANFLLVFIVTLYPTPKALMRFVNVSYSNSVLIDNFHEASSSPLLLSSKILLLIGLTSLNLFDVICNTCLVLLKFKDVPEPIRFNFKLLLFCTSIINFATSYLWEVIIVQKILVEKLSPMIRRLRGGDVHMFEKIDREMRESEGWPPHPTHFGRDPYNTRRLASVTQSIEETTNDFGFKIKKNKSLWPKNCVTTSKEDISQPESALYMFPAPVSDGLSTFRRGVKMSDFKTEDETTKL